MYTSVFDWTLRQTTDQCLTQPILWWLLSGSNLIFTNSSNSGIWNACIRDHFSVLVRAWSIFGLDFWPDWNHFYIPIVYWMYEIKCMIHIKTSCQVMASLNWWSHDIFKSKPTGSIYLRSIPLKSNGSWNRATILLAYLLRNFWFGLKV